MCIDNKSAEALWMSGRLDEAEIAAGSDAVLVSLLKQLVDTKGRLVDSTEEGEEDRHGSWRVCADESRKVTVTE